ncbi:MAG: hypothetical protein QF464_06400 [Myxococcota bacterium]|jgi:mannose-6-phosphate isomerase-like protein (cupin superfamily)|nr:hypothetical protein [Myxococcota bacterium]
MAMTVSDLGRTLLTLDEAAAATAVVPLLDSPGQQWSVITVAAGESWSTTSVAARSLGFVALEGCATCADESGRQSIGSGHVVAIGAGESLTVTNEEKSPFRALVASTSDTLTSEGKS